MAMGEQRSAGTMNHFHLQARTTNIPAIAYGLAVLDQKTNNGRVATTNIAATAPDRRTTRGMNTTVKTPARANGNRTTYSLDPNR